MRQGILLVGQNGDGQKPGVVVVVVGVVFFKVKYKTIKVVTTTGGGVQEEAEFTTT